VILIPRFPSPRSPFAGRWAPWSRCSTSLVPVEMVLSARCRHFLVGGLTPSSHRGRGVHLEVPCAAACCCSALPAAPSGRGAVLGIRSRPPCVRNCSPQLGMISSFLPAFLLSYHPPTRRCRRRFASLPTPPGPLLHHGSLRSVLKTSRFYGIAFLVAYAAVVFLPATRN
jgi:hypothetical protein